MNSIFRNAMDEIDGDSWLDDLTRASLSAAHDKFFGEHYDDASLRITFDGLRVIEAHDSHLITKAIQNATAKLGHIIRQPRSEVYAAYAADRAKATLIQRSQVGNVIVFGFARAEESDPESYLPGTRPATLAEQAARELVSVLPTSPNDDIALDAVLAQRPTIRNAVNDVVNAFPRSAEALDMRLNPGAGQAVSSVLSLEQAGVLRDSLRESRLDKRITTMTGRLDGVRTRRRIFYLEPESGGDIHGALDLELLDDIRQYLNRRVTVKLEIQRSQALSGRKSRPLYRLLSIVPAGETLPD